MSVRSIVLALFVLGFLGFGLWYTRRPIKVPQEIMMVPTSQPLQQSPLTEAFYPYTARFNITTNGTVRTFTDQRYHFKSEDVFIDPAEPNTVQVKKQGITWKDFFATLPMQLTRECLVTGTKQTFCDGEGGELRFSLNGAERGDALEQEIQDGDELVVTFR